MQVRSLADGANPTVRAVRRNSTLDENPARSLEVPYHTRTVPNRIFPLINPREPERLWHVWPEIECSIIAINYIGLRKTPELLERARSRGIKEALEYSGTVISALIGDNWELERTQVSEYASDLDQMGFDYGTTHDDYVYPDDNTSIQWDRIQTMLARADSLVSYDPDSRLIGVVQGSTSQQIRFAMLELGKMGIERMALPCADSLQRKRYRGVVDFLRIGGEMGAWRWLVGVNSPTEMLRFRADGMSGYGWCYMAAKGQIYRDSKLVRPTAPGFCKHEVCRAIKWKGLTPEEQYSRHNILTWLELNSKLGGNETLE
jgi:hypothetical protein